ncbi:MAG TPA: hypothetical protein VFN09_01235 [Rhodanobacteraceae bacterium]|nr:hypothetical protein [Rhodanobacteraceae bacterium]
MHRIVLVADDPALLHAWRQRLEYERDLTLLAEARSGVDAETVIAVLQPDLLVLGLSPGTAIAALAQLPSWRELAPDLRVLVLAGPGAGAAVSTVLAAGADGYLDADAGSVDLLPSMRAVLAGECVRGAPG